MSGILVTALYKFVPLTELTELQSQIKQICVQAQIRGTLLLASEGINGTIAGEETAVRSVLAQLREDPRLSDLAHKESWANTIPFDAMKVRLKKEIVTMGVSDIDPTHIVGTYVEPKDWNALISDPDVLLVDTRNDYEVEIGTFENAVNPETQSFREFPQYVANHLDPAKHKKVAMFCTGGIRCEKSTAFLKQQGFDEVYHLKGGILKYLEEVPESESKWQGECFVFDNRVTVNHQLEQGDYDQCHACRRPITEHDKQSEHYQKGVSCHRCYNQQTAEQTQRYRERERQIVLAKQRGEAHIGQPMADTIAQRKQEKLRFKAAQREKDRRS